MDHTELGEEWERQAGWSKAVKRRRQVLEDDQEEAPAEAQEGASGEAQEEQTGGLDESRVQKEKEAALMYEKRQMLWKGMAGRSWTELVQQWGVPQVEALQLQKSIAALMREMGPKLGDLHWKESTGLGKEGRVLPAEAMGMLAAARTARRLRALSAPNFSCLGLVLRVCMKETSFLA